MDTPETVKILEVRKETPTVNTIVLEKKCGIVDFGQFFMVWVPGVGEKPYACSKYTSKNMEITVKHVGPFSEKLQNLKKGDLVGVRGPYGNGCFTQKGNNPCFVAGGLGIVPLICLIERLKGSGKKVTVILGAKTKEELVFAERVKKAGADLRIVTDDGSAGEKAFPHQLLAGLIKEKKIDQVYCCGPEVMMREVLKIALDKKIPAQFSLERYMKCGIGLCGSCALDPSGLLVCKDGPVFDAEKIKDTEFGKYRRDAAGSKIKI
jgi:dihydroorotate dehydrogenase electron transfer subunit